MPVKGYNVG